MVRCQLETCFNHKDGGEEVVQTFQDVCLCGGHRRIISSDGENIQHDEEADDEVEGLSRDDVVMQPVSHFRSRDGSEDEGWSEVEHELLRTDP